MSKVAILVGSVYGAAEDLAENVAQTLAAQSIEQKLFIESSLEDILNFEPTVWLVITSTTGAGDIPDNLAPLYDELREQFPNLSNAKYSVIAMGDSSYVDSYCGAGKQFNELMKALMAAEIQAPLEIDSIETMDPVEYSEDWVSAFIGKV